MNVWIDRNCLYEKYLSQISDGRIKQLVIFRDDIICCRDIFRLIDELNINKEKVIVINCSPSLGIRNVPENYLEQLDQFPYKKRVIKKDVLLVTSDKQWKPLMKGYMTLMN